MESAGGRPLALRGPDRGAPSAHLHPGTEGCSLTLSGEWLHRVGLTAAIPLEGSHDEAIDQSCSKQAQVAAGGSGEGLFQLR